MPSRTGHCLQPPLWLLIALVTVGLLSAVAAHAPSGATALAATGVARASPALPLAGEAIAVKRGDRTIPVHPYKMTRTPSGREALAGRLILGFRNSLSEAGLGDVHRRAAALGVPGARAVESVGRFAQLVDVSGVPSLEVALQAYRSDPRVKYAEPDYIYHTEGLPNDPLAGQQWAIDKLQLPAAWDMTQGSRSRFVAILDCGIYEAGSTANGQGHPDINGKITLRRDFTGSPYGTDDFCNHGTWVAGLAAASTNNRLGVAGVGYDVALFNGKVLNDLGQGTLSSFVNGLVWAVDHGANVVNLSFSSPGPCTPIEQEAINYAWDNGAVVVAAAGNDGSAAPQAPASCANVVAVAATDRADARASFSSYGPWVEVAAPGVDILSLDHLGGYMSGDGTSPATALVSGLAGLIWSTEWGDSNAAVVERLLAHADPISGTGDLWQHGRVNAYRAVAEVAPFCNIGQTPQFLFGFAALSARLGPTMGDPIECEHTSPQNGDTLQQTTAGLAFYRAASNTPTFTTGFEHWALTPAGLVYWTGRSIDPLSGATPLG